MPRNPTAPHLRVLERVRVSESGCWVYQGALTGGGYGKVYSGGRTLLTHRVVYEAMVEEISDGKQIDHLCNTKPCVNPKHLMQVTQEQNMARTRKEFCIHGHNLSENEQKVGNTRRCGKCHAENQKKYTTRKRGQ
jgi:hypothetical protein